MNSFYRALLKASRWNNKKSSCDLCPSNTLRSARDKTSAKSLPSKTIIALDAVVRQYWPNVYFFKFWLFPCDANLRSHQPLWLLYFEIFSIWSERPHPYSSLVSSCTTVSRVRWIIMKGWQVMWISGRISAVEFIDQFKHVNHNLREGVGGGGTLQILKPWSSEGTPGAWCPSEVLFVCFFNLGSLKYYFSFIFPILFRAN